MFFETVLKRHAICKFVVMIIQVVYEGVTNVVVLDEFSNHVLTLFLLCNLLDPLESFPIKSSKDKDVLVLVLEVLVLLFCSTVVVYPWEVLS